MWKTPLWIMVLGKSRDHLAWVLVNPAIEARGLLKIFQNSSNETSTNAI
jgi:hypothetical protein